MKTAVEWLEDNLITMPWMEEHFKHNTECWNKAKEMEKEQLIEAYYYDPNCDDIKDDGEQYYNKTFKSE